MSLKRLQAKLIEAGLTVEIGEDGVMIVGGPTGYHGHSASHAHKRLDTIHQNHGAHTPKAKQHIALRTSRTSTPAKLHQWHKALTDNGYHEEAEHVQNKMRGL